MQHMTLEQALAALDPNNDADWTATGEPAMARLEELTGDASLRRVDVRNAFPNAHRSEAAAKVEQNANANSDQERTPQAPSADLASDEGPMVESARGVHFSGPLSVSAEAVAILIDASMEDGEFNAVTLMEAAVAASQQDRFMRNSALQSLMRGYRATQTQIKDHQGRLDARISDRARQNKEAKARGD